MRLGTCLDTCFWCLAFSVWLKASGKGFKHFTPKEYLDFSCRSIDFVWHIRCPCRQANLFLKRLMEEIKSISTRMFGKSPCNYVPATLVMTKFNINIYWIRIVETFSSSEYIRWPWIVNTATVALYQACHFLAFPRPTCFPNGQVILLNIVCSNISF